MIQRDTTSTLAKRRKHLTGLGKLPPPAAHRPALHAIAFLSLVADAGIEHGLVPNCITPRVVIRGYRTTNPLGRQLLRDLAEMMAAPAYGATTTINAAAWLQNHDLGGVVLHSLQISHDDAARNALLTYAAETAKAFTEIAASLQDEHMTALVQRDLPGPIKWCRWWPDEMLPWLLASEFDKDPSRALRAERRYQALRLYGSLADRLRAPAITATIDAGEELAPVLAHRLHLTRGQIRALREAVDVDLFCREPAYERRNRESVVRLLLAHAIPLWQWPGGGRGGQHAAWETSPWRSARTDDLLPAEYYAVTTDGSTVRDAVKAFDTDLLRPLLTEPECRAFVAKYSADRRQYARAPFAHDATEVALQNNHELTPALRTAVQNYLGFIRRTLVGMRGPKAFAEAAIKWHRRVAAIAALRDEQQAARPGWPALCPPWKSACGAYQIVPLTTARELVDEGNAHQHCVGTYYDECRRGRTQILSLRQNGVPAVTVEILLERKFSKLRVGQFKGSHNEIPDDPALHEAMRAFLRDVRSGVHPLHLREIKTWCEQIDERENFFGEALPSLDHAREIFPLYLSLLPRGTPESFDAWCATSGLRESLLTSFRAIDAALIPDS
jgi:PcfJ-like protein